MLKHKAISSAQRGFTLIELSIVLVIIGLIAGGILVGRDMIKAAEVRSQITQIERYNTAIRTFQIKYGALPGDLTALKAAQFGFQIRGPDLGEGDGNGIIAGNLNGSGPNGASGSAQNGEPAMLWVDLSQVGLIDGRFTQDTATNPVLMYSQPNSSFLPGAKIGQGNSVLVWSLGNANYFAVLNVGYLHLDYSGYVIESSSMPGTVPNAGFSVAQAYSIDSKIDDGYPQTGRVITISPADTAWQWAGTSSLMYGVSFPVPYTTATSGSATSCFDNGGLAGRQNYSMEINNGDGINCTLSFKFQ